MFRFGTLWLWIRHSSRFVIRRLPSSTYSTCIELWHLQALIVLTTKMQDRTITQKETNFPAVRKKLKWNERFSSHAGVEMSWNPLLTSKLMGVTLSMGCHVVFIADSSRRRVFPGGIFMSYVLPLRDQWMPF